MLDEIVRRKRTDLAARMERVPLDAVKNGISPSRRSLAAALSAPGSSFILEAKKASPSLGMIRADFDPVAVAREYEPFADALSILTDTPYFGGSHEYLTAVRSVTEKPLVCKDFIISPYQVYEARGFGADAVLLMLSVLDDAAYIKCAKAAEELSMDALTEVHDEPELRRALSLGAGIIGINNRNLKTLKVDLKTTERLAPLVPKDRIVVCESGITGREDLKRLSGQADAFLVGSSLMKEENLGRAVRELLFGKVKICGLTNAEDAVTAYRLGAVYGGLIFAPESPRRVSLKEAEKITAAAPLSFTGVFVNQPVDEAADIAKTLALSAVQLHGDEDAAYISALRGRLAGGSEIWKAVRVSGAVPNITEYGCDRILLDAYDKKARGGTGRVFEWGLLDGRQDKDRLIIAGGINPDNAAAAAAMGCYAIDVNSGVEESAGKKSGARLENLFSALRG